MPLNDKQWAEMYKASIQSSTDILWIREELQANNADMRKCFECINSLKNEQSFLKGYLMRLAIGVTAICTIVVNAILWAVSHFWGK